MKSNKIKAMLAIGCVFSLIACNNGSTTSSEGSSDLSSEETVSSSEEVISSEETISSEEVVSSEKIEFSKEKFLQSLSGEIALSGTVTAGGNSVNSKTFISAEEYYVEMSNKEVNEKAHYLKDEDGYLLQAYLDRKNTVNYSKSSVADSSEYAKFDDYVINPFSLLTAEQLSFDEASTVTIALSNDAMKQVFPIMIVGMPFVTTEMSVEVDQNYTPVGLEMTFVTSASGEGEVMTYQYAGDFCSKEALEMDVVKPLTNTGNELLTQAFDKLKNGNYTVTCYSDQVSETEPVWTLYFDKTVGYLVNNYSLGSYYGEINNPDGEGVITVEVQDDGWGGQMMVGSKDGATTAYTLDSYVPSFDYDTNLFSKENNVFTLEAAYHEASHLLVENVVIMSANFVDEGTLNFEVAEDLSKVTVRYGFDFINYANLKIEITEIGTTTLPLDVETQYSPFTGATCWEDVVGDDSFDAFMYLGSSPDDIIPFVDGSWNYWLSSDGLEFYVDDLTQEEADDLKWNFESELAFNASFEYVGEEDDGWGGTVSVYTHVDTGITVNVSVSEFFGSYQFTIKLVAPVQ